MASGTNALDMALDDVISQTRTDKRRQNNSGRGGGGMRGGGGISKPNRGGAGFRSGNNNFSRQPYGSRPSYRSGNQSYNTQAPRSTRNQLVVSNLHYNVTENDLYELFGQMGKLKRAYLHLAPSGGSSGVADIVYMHPQDAERASASYNNVELDGRPMRISFATQPGAAPQQSAGGAMRRPMRGGNQGGYTRGGSRGGRGSGGNRRRQDNRPRPSEADLDADMDSYMTGPTDGA
ncbi:hypothetical protein BDB00DRAFT_817553 [Zychaea mexicana]|uniref:uncharacterized protein n=1 Tax=Zychaea mexicana TaxID=64656 RepID=UPI0022FE285D|nr:uncharacterized protein BDB00DRAFT_817553 [Zychaea mexicana]KAI9494620.1 hypothetical protein BDB00DRAFT_817553 [Zychaea mexicana]